MNRRIPVGVGRMNNNPNKHSTERLDKKTARGVFLRLSGYVMKCWPLFITAIIFTLLSNQLALMGPEYSGNALDAIVAEGGVNFNAVWETK